MAVAAVPTLTLTSCEDLLDKPSFTSDSLEFVFSNESSAEVYVQGCYRGLIHEEQYRQYNSGETVTIPCEEELRNSSKWQIGNYFYDPILPATLTTTYNEGYRIIEACNVGISYIRKLEQTNKVKALLGELYTLRAFAYHNLIKFYGDVPAVWESVIDLGIDNPEVYLPKRTSRDEIYDRVIGEMQEYIPYLPWWSEAKATYGVAPNRLTRQAALGILARICLHAGGYSLRWDLATNDPGSLQMKRRDDAARVRELYEIADDALRQVITKGENDLVKASGDMNAFQNLFYNYCQRNFDITSTEMMWQQACLGTTTNSSFGVYNGQPGSVGGLYGQRKTLQCKLPTYYLSFDEKDIRRDVTCCNYSITFKNKNDINDEWANVGTTYSCIMGGKFRIQWATEPAETAKRNIDIPILRYADILLMYAETQNYLNSPTAGAPYLQLVRDRAGIGDKPIDTSSKEAFLDEIMQERKWEFADEFLLRSDLIRTDLLDKNIQKCKEEMLDLADNYCRNTYGKAMNNKIYRIYHYEKNAQVYGDKFLTVPYYDVPWSGYADLRESSNFDTQKYQAAITKLLESHGVTNDGKWYAVNMFQAWTSDYNKARRLDVGFSGESQNQLQIGMSIYTKPSYKQFTPDNGIPEWVSDLFYGYQRNKTELFPFAAKSAGHPLIDNPNLTQHPGYM